MKQAITNNAAVNRQPTRRQARLILEDGSEFQGFSFGKARSLAGEVVFTTTMSGFPQTLTDPGYRGQILVAAYPLVTGCNIPVAAKTGETIFDSQGLPVELESNGIQISGFIAAELLDDPGCSLSAWLEKNNVPGICGIDTRVLVKRLREHGVMRGKILVEGTRDVTLDSGSSANPVEEVSVQEVKKYLPAEQDKKTNEKKPKENKTIKIAFIDCGAKANIIRCLLNRNVEITVFPWNHEPGIKEFDGFVLSGGPGDPKACGKTIAAIRRAFDSKKPVFGIGLGCNIMALAAGADTYKLPWGHRGGNQPCIETTTSRCYVTSQNHGYAIRSESLPKSWEPWFINGNDNSIEGIRSLRDPFSAVQFQPEGSPGSRDTEFLFDKFLAQIKEMKNA